MAFKGFDGDLDVNVLQFWVAAFQVVTNFVAMPIYTLPVLGAQQVPLSRMPALMTGGTRCLFFLEDQVKLNCGAAFSLAGVREHVGMPLLRVAYGALQNSQFLELDRKYSRRGRHGRP